MGTDRFVIALKTFLLLLSLRLVILCGPIIRVLAATLQFLMGSTVRQRKGRHLMHFICVLTLSIFSRSGLHGGHLNSQTAVTKHQILSPAPRFD